MQEGCPYLNWDVVWSSTATMYGWVRARTANLTSADNVHLNADNPGNASSESGLLGFKVATSPPAHYWKWWNVNSSAAVRSFSATAGAGSVQACVQNQGFFLDKVAFTSSSTADPNTLGDPGFNPSIDGNYGPAESTQGTGTIPDLNFVEAPSIPSPGAGLAASRYQPFDGSTVALTSDLIIASFNGVGSISIDSGSGVTQNGNPISGTVFANYITIPGTGDVGQVIFRPAGPLTKGATYVPLFTGVLIDSNGDSQPLNTSGWSFQVIDPDNDTDIHIYEDFNQYAEDYYYRLTDMQTVFNHGLLGYSPNVAHGQFSDTARMQVVTDPTAQGNMGKVLRCKHPGGSTVSDAMSFRADVGGGPWDEMYMSYKIFLPPGHIWPDIHKIPGLGTGTLANMSHEFGVIPVPDGTVAFTAIGEIFGGEPAAWGSPRGSHATTFYDATVTQKPDWFSDTDTTNGWDGSTRPDDYNILQTGNWYHVERFVKMNTIGSANGIDRGWVDGLLKLNRTDRTWRVAGGEDMSCDGGWMYCHYNYNNVLGWAPLPYDQYIYYKDFVFSKVPIGNDGI